MEPQKGYLPAPLLQTPLGVPPWVVIKKKPRKTNHKPKRKPRPKKA